jgi:hypothetical protein
MKQELTDMNVQVTLRIAAIFHKLILHPKFKRTFKSTGLTLMTLFYQLVFEFISQKMSECPSDNINVVECLLAAALTSQTQLCVCGQTHTHSYKHEKRKGNDT